MTNINYTMKYLFKWLIVSSLLGAVGSILAFLLLTTIEFLTYFRQGISPIITIGVVGVLLYFLYLWDPRARGHGTNHYLVAVNEDHHVSKFKHAFTKFIATILTIGSGGSGGLTGPTLQIGAGVSSLLEKWFQKEEVRLLLLSGAAGMLGAVLHSPIGAGLFVVEITYRTSLHYKDTFPAILASSSGYLFSRYFFRQNALIDLNGNSFHSESIPFILLAAILGGLVAAVYIFFLKTVQETYKESTKKPILFISSFLLVGAFVTMVPEAGGLGSNLLTGVLYNSSTQILLILLIAKLITTTLTVGVGGSGGLVLPALILGAISAALIGSLIGLPYYMYPILIITGMAATLSGAANAPIAVSILMVEIGGAEFAIAAVIGSIIGYAITNTATIYDSNTDPYETV